MDNDLTIKHQNVEQYIRNSIEQLNKEHQVTISDETLKKGIEEFTSSKYDAYTEEQIYQEINNIIQKMLEERELRKQEFLKKQQELRQAKFEELKKLYLETKEKYKNIDYSIVQTMDVQHMQSYNGTKEVQLLNQFGETLSGFYKGVSSPNEYELLVSRLGKICDIPVADYSLYLDNGTVDGISISCIPDKERYDFLSGYDFVKMYPEVSEVVTQIQNNPQLPKPELSRDQTQYYMDILLKGFAERVKNPEQLEQLKKDYFKAVLFNAILDQKDFNYTNFAVLYDKLNDSYQMAPLFDNGAIKNNDSLEGTYITTLGRSKKDDVIDLLFTEYYDYVSDFTKQLMSENEKLSNGEPNMLSDMMTCVDDTLIHSEAESYKQVVQSTLQKVVERERLKQNIQNVYYQYPTEDRSKDIKGKVYIMSPNPEKGFIKEVISKEKTIQQTQQPKGNAQVYSQANNTPKKTGSFVQRSQSEIQVYNKIKEKNQKIKQQKNQQKQANKPNVKTLTQSSHNGGGSNSSKGFANTIILSLFVSFVAGALFMIVYMLIKG